MATSQSPITRIVLLGLENRSFDHLLGRLPREGHLRSLDGLDGTESNHLVPADPTSPTFMVHGDAMYEMYREIPGIGPPHSFLAANQQMTGSTAAPTGRPDVRQNGYVAAWDTELRDQMWRADITGEPNHRQLSQVMAHFTPDRLPALSTLAQEFVLCDRWFSSVPGPTMPNRLYWHAATSAGYAHNAWSDKFDFTTIYNRLHDAARTWRIYYGNDDVAHNFTKLPTGSGELCGLDTFFSDADAGQLPEYSYIVPRFISWTGPDQGMYEANSQHAPSDVAAGERLICRVYEALRSNKELWESTVLVVTYDEHGGFYDHVVPPGDVPNPDGLRATDPDFDFTRLGVRVPAVIVSPWLPKTLDHTQYEHASIPATIGRHFGLSGPLTRRDEAANSLEGWFTGEGGLRTDTPERLEAPDHRFDTRLEPLDDVQVTIVHGAIDRVDDESRRDALHEEVEQGMTQHRAGQLLASIVPRPG